MSTTPWRALATTAGAWTALALAAACGAPTRPAAQPPAPASARAAPTAASPAGPPPTRQGETVERYHGVEVSDPYRWLEDPDSDETRAWIKAQNAHTFAHLERITARPAIHHRLEAMWTYDRRLAPRKVQSSYFQLRQAGLQNQPVLWVAPTDHDEGRILLDPNALAADGTVALKQAAVSHDGAVVAWMTSAAGSDWAEIRFRDVASGRDRPDHLRWVKFSGIAWAHDGSGIYYSAYDAPTQGKALTALNEWQRLYFHKLGTDQAADVVVASSKEHKEWGFGGGVTDDGRLLVVPVWKGATKTNALRIGRLPLRPGARPAPNKSIAGPSPLGGAPSAWVEIDMTFDLALDVAGNVGDRLLVRTDWEAPRGRIVAIDLAQPARPQWRTVVAEGAETLVDARVVGGRLVLQLLRDARSVLRVHELDGRLVGEIPLPTLGTVAQLSGDAGDAELYVLFESFTWPGAVLRVTMATLATTTLWQPKLPFSAEDFTVEQHFAPSRDGTRVPYFLVRRGDVKPNGKRPVWLHAYGGFDIAMVPSFRVDRLQWVEMGGLYVLANLRGGGEYGRAWHEAGMLANKQNVFEDFYAIARDLHQRQWAEPASTAIAGGSNGGLLVGAAITQHPELFGAALPAVGVMDMLRYHRWTIGWAWVPEYGSSDDAKAFEWLRAYSPLHNARPQRYPATMVTTADHDDRVVPAHSFKFAAALQAAQRGPAPILIRIEEKAGHGAGKPTAKRIDEAADAIAFFVGALGPERFDRLPRSP